MEYQKNENLLDNAQNQPSTINQNQVYKTKLV